VRRITTRTNDHQNNDRTLKKPLFASLPHDLQTKAAAKDLEMSERGNWYFLQALFYLRNMEAPDNFQELPQEDRHDISTTTASAFPQQDIGMLCDALKPKLDALSLAGMLDPLALKQVLQAFVDADWGGVLQINTKWQPKRASWTVCWNHWAR
jgi:hypothetical protein